MAVHVDMPPEIPLAPTRAGIVGGLISGVIATGC